MCGAFLRSDYYGSSAPPPGLGSATDLPTTGLAVRWEGDRGWFPRSPLDHSFREVPSYIPVASPRLRRRPSPWPPARPLQPGPELTIQLHAEGGWLRATDRPVSTRFEPVHPLRDFDHWFTCVAPSDLAWRTRIVWSCRHIPPLSGLLPTLPGVPRSGRVAGAHCCAPAPSELPRRLSPQAAQASLEDGSDSKRCGPALASSELALAGRVNEAGLITVR
jgi:hypothetical protein